MPAGHGDGQVDPIRERQPIDALQDQGQCEARLHLDDQRRLSGTLLLCMFLHGFWDSSVFLPGATGDDPFPGAMLVYVVAIVCVIGVLRKNRGIFVR